MREAAGSQDDLQVGSFRPDAVSEPRFERLPDAQLRALAERPGISATAADFLERHGYRLAVPATTLPSIAGGAAAVGHVITVRYLPRRKQAAHYLGTGAESRLAFRTAFSLASPGDVVVMAGGHPERSLMGGNAAAAAVAAGVAGCVLDGVVRDLDEIAATGLPVWARGSTPLGATYDVEAVEINGPISLGGVQVVPGDLVVADVSGMAFVPNELAESFLAEQPSG